MLIYFVNLKGLEKQQYLKFLLKLLIVKKRKFLINVEIALLANKNIYLDIL